MSSGCIAHIPEGEAGVAALRREASRSSDSRLRILLRLAEAYAQPIRDLDSSADPDLPVICPRLKLDARSIRTISTVMRFDTAIDVTASELRVGGARSCSCQCLSSRLVGFNQKLV